VEVEIMARVLANDIASLCPKVRAGQVMLFRRPWPCLPLASSPAACVRFSAVAKVTMARCNGGMVEPKQVEQHHEGPWPVARE